MTHPTAAPRTFPYPHRTLEQVYAAEAEHERIILATIERIRQTPPKRFRSGK